MFIFFVNFNVECLAMYSLVSQSCALLLDVHTKNLELRIFLEACLSANIFFCKHSNVIFQYCFRLHMNSDCERKFNRV
jgi:hypothetical protein